MTIFWKIRIATFAWGALVLYGFTQSVDFTSKVFLAQVLGNTLIMWWFTR
jgi:hypothetical protein